MPRKPRTERAAPAPQFDELPLADDEEEGACPIPDDDGEIVLRRGKTTKGGKRGGKGKTEKPGR